MGRGEVCPALQLAVCPWWTERNGATLPYSCLACSTLRIPFRGITVLSDGVLVTVYPANEPGMPDPMQPCPDFVGGLSCGRDLVACHSVAVPLRGFGGFLQMAGLAPRKRIKYRSNFQFSRYMYPFRATIFALFLLQGSIH